jgi:hypothetical protein
VHPPLFKVTIFFVFLNEILYIIYYKKLKNLRNIYLN